MTTGPDLPMDANVRVHIVDDDDSLRVALSRLLSAAGYQPQSYACAGDFLVAHPTMPAGCLLLDLHMPGPDGLALQDALRQRGWTMPTVFLSGRGDVRTSVKALKAGANDFLTKPVDADTLLQAISAAVQAGAQAQVELEMERDASSRLGGLNERERKVLQWVLKGTLTRDIARQLGVSERTVKSCRASVMEKLGAASLAELVAKAGDPAKL